MKKTYHLYFDDTGSRDPDKTDLVDGDVRRDRMDCFAFGGVLVKNEEVDGIFAAHNAFCRAHDKIGRASCRARVCQYVSISVVAVPLKKKKTNKKRRATIYISQTHM